MRRYHGRGWPDGWTGWLPRFLDRRKALLSCSRAASVPLPLSGRHTRRQPPTTTALPLMPRTRSMAA